MGGAYPTVFCCLACALAGATAALAAATVSSGLMVCVFAVLVFWCTGLQHGPKQSGTAPFFSLCVVILGMTTTTLYQLVQHGIQFAITQPPSEDSGNENNVLAGLTTQILADVCDKHMHVSLGNHTNHGSQCVDVLSELLPDNYAYNYTIPGDGNFAGQTAHLTWSAPEKSLNVFIPGGLWIVKGLWTWGGLTNPLAYVQGLLVAMAWAFLVVSVGILLPPARTARSIVRVQLVTSITQAIQVFKDEVSYRATETSTMQRSAAPPARGGAVTGSTHVDENEKAEQKSMEEDAVQAMIKSVMFFKGGGLAPMTSVEPRCTRAPFDVSWTHLIKLVESVRRLLMAALSLKRRSAQAEVPLPRLPAGIEHDLRRLETCATAIRACRDYEGFAPLLLEEDHCLDEEGPEDSDMFSDSMKHVMKAVQTNTVHWLAAFNQKKFGRSYDLRPWTKSGLKNYATGWLPYLAGSINVIKRLAMTATLPFRPHRWNWRVVLHDAEYTLGITLLVIMEVYWRGYRDFALTPGWLPPDTTNPFVTSDSSPPPNLFAGWALLAYIFASMPTVEGSTKKGLLRAAGTIAGAFSAWIAVLVCSGGSYDPNPDISPVALGAWLAVTGPFFAYWFIPPGPAALMGFDPDVGYFSMYFVMTQAVVAMDIYGGSGTRGEVVVNRIVGNLTGIAMAMVVAWLPPQVRGSDPVWLQRMVGHMTQVTTKGLRLLLSDGIAKSEAFEHLGEEYTKEASAAYNQASFYVKDATRFLKAPFFKMDPKIPQQMTTLMFTGSSVYLFLLAAGTYEEDRTKQKDKQATDDGDALFRDCIRLALAHLDEPQNDVELADLKNKCLASRLTPDQRVLLSMVYNILLSLEEHDAILKQVPVPSKYLTWDDDVEC